MTQTDFFLEDRAVDKKFVCIALVFLALVPREVATPEVTEENVKAALPTLATLAEQTLQKTGVPGMAIAIVYQDKVAYLKGFGVRVVGKPETVDADTVFQLASVSKPLASTVVAALITGGQITWDSRIADLDPTFQMYDPWVTRAITLRDLFAHRSGLPDHAGDLLEDLGYSRDEILSRLRHQKPDSSFRGQYAYTNFGLTAAAVAAARAMGKTWEDVATEKLYKPLGMTRTSSRYADFAAAPNHAHLHVPVDGTWVGKHTRDPDAQSPAGGVSSSARDMAQWLRLQLGNGRVDGKQIIDAEALAETHRPQIISQAPHNPATDRAGFYGLGWNVNYDDRSEVRLSHSGAFNLGAATAVVLLPADALGIVVLTNGYPIGVPEAVSKSIVELVLNGKVEKDWLEVFRPLVAELFKPDYGMAIDYREPPAQPSPALASNAYVGNYRNAFFGELAIVAGKAGPVLQLGPHKTPFPLQHYDRDVFTYQPVGENAAGLSAVTFTVDAAGKATRLVIENLNIHGEGAFTRVSTAK
jgi:CubicO group peptidase (beta-lactamase class C family)